MKQSFKIRANNIRRNIMRSFTRNIGKAHSYEDIAPDANLTVNRILLVRPNNRLGNLLLITPLLQEIETTFPDCKIDVFVRGFLAPILFKNYSNVDGIIELPKKPFKRLVKYISGWARIKNKRYDIVVNVVNNSSSGRLSVQFARSKYKFYGDSITSVFQPDDNEVHIAKYPVYNFRKFIGMLGITPNASPVANLDLKLSPEELAQGKNALQQLVKNNNKTLCIFTYATGAKCYPPAWWEPFYALLKEHFPESDYNIVEVLPAENVSQIGFKAPSFYSKDVRQIGALMANTAIFIGADSGIMHLASAVQVPVAGLFVNNNINTYKPYGNGSVAIDTKTTTVEQCITIVKTIIR
jgi:heptosyltransferase-3